MQPNWEKFWDAPEIYILESMEWSGGEGGASSFIKRAKSEATYIFCTSGGLCKLCLFTGQELRIRIGKTECERKGVNWNELS